MTRDLWVMVGFCLGVTVVICEALIWAGVLQ